MVMSNGEDYSEYETLLADVKSIFDRSETEKKQKIQELAKKLDWLGHKQKDIAKKIAKDLKGYAVSSYVYQCLDDKYKTPQDRYYDLETSTVELTNDQKQNERETEKKKIVLEQTTTGTTLLPTTVPDFKPVTDEANNDQFGKGVVPMTNEEEKPILNLQPQNVRMIMSNGKFHALIRHMTDFYEQNKTRAKSYAIEYDPQEKELYVDVAEEGEIRNIDG